MTPDSIHTVCAIAQYDYSVGTNPCRDKIRKAGRVGYHGREPERSLEEKRIRATAEEAPHLLLSAAN